MDIINSKHPEYMQNLESEGTHYFRYDGYEHANCDCLRIIKKTPKGVWVSLGYDDKKFILDDARKRWAYPSIKEALESFRIRKERQIRHCNFTIE